MAWPEPARHPGHAGLRHRCAVEEAAEEGPRLDPVHRGNANRAGLCRLHARRDPRRAEAQAGTQLHGHLYRCAPLRAAHLCQHPERADAQARFALHGRQVVPGLPRKAPEAGSTFGHLCRCGYRRVHAAAAGPVGGSARAHFAGRFQRAQPRRTYQRQRHETRSHAAGCKRPPCPCWSPRRAADLGPVGREALGRAAVGRRRHGACTPAARPGPGVPLAGSRHANPVGRRTAAPAAGHAAQLVAVRRAVRA
ncbi:hypothetical protein D3C81_1538350 [compost metagenome]